MEAVHRAAEERMSHRLPQDKKHRRLTPISKARKRNVIIFMVICLVIGVAAGVIFVTP
jgi:hypothetical protein